MSNKKEISTTESMTNIVDNLTKEIEKIDNKKSRFIFFVMDTKGNPNGSLFNIYETAKVLSDMGYDVSMLHAEKEFIGVREWMGDAYADIKHYNIEKDGVKVSPSDILIIPELLSNVMFQTNESKLPCKRVVLLQNRYYITEVIQPGASWLGYGIIDCVATSEKLANEAKELFHGLRTNVVKPVIKDVFKDTGKPKGMFINLVTKSQSDTNRIVKEFFLRYPQYKWVPFRGVSGLPTEDLADVFKESFATVWVDDITDFGYSALEAMNAGNIVIGKIPEEEPEWMFNKDGKLVDNGIWFYKISECYDLIAGAINAFLNDTIPDSIYKEGQKTAANYSEKEFAENVKKVYVDTLLENRKKELESALEIAKNNFEKVKSE